MNIKDFEYSTKELFEKWFTNINIQLKNGNIKTDGYISFPTNVRIGISQDHYLVDFLGSQAPCNIKPITLSITKERIKTSSEFYNPGFKKGGKPVINIDCIGSSLINISIYPSIDFEAFKRKTNIIFRNPGICYKFDADIPIFLSENADKIILSNVEVIKSDDLRLYYHYINHGIVVKKNTSVEDYSNWIDSKFIDTFSLSKYSFILGINTIDLSINEKLRKDLFSLADQNVKENIIDDFLKRNASIFSKALNYQSAISQPHLKWIKRENSDPVEVIPDYLLKNEKGFYDILDLKKSLLLRKAITGKIGRYKYSSYITDLILKKSTCFAGGQFLNGFACKNSLISFSLINGSVETSFKAPFGG